MTNTTSNWPKLPKAFKKKWLAALRSGKFKQGRQQLLTIDTHMFSDKETKRYCCLGVAACTVGYTDRKLGRDGLMDSDKDWRKVPTILRGDTDNHLVDQLTTMNDKQGSSFKKIADWIDKNL